MTEKTDAGETAKGRLDDVSHVRKSKKDESFIVAKVSGTRYYCFDDEKKLLALIERLQPIGGTVVLEGVLGGQYPTFRDGKMLPGESRPAEKTPKGKDWVRVGYEREIGVTLGNAVTRAVEIAIHDPTLMNNPSTISEVEIDKVDKILENAGKIADWQLGRLRKELGMGEK